MKAQHLILVCGLLLVVVALAFGVTAQEPAEDPVGEPPTFLVEFYEAWVSSPHARFEDEAFQHWNEDGEVEANCAQCHSTPGYLDFLGADGTDAGVDAPAALGTVINCDACHNSVASNLTAVTFPSGAELTNLGSSARCMVCHQGRSSGVQVNTALEEAGVLEDMNTPNENLRFINIHYYAAAASLYGAEAHGGYEFADQAYQLRGDHVEDYNTCADCHDTHTLEVKVQECSRCHEGVESVEDLHAVRMEGSLVDYDGDGDIEEGIKGEIETLQETLYAAIQAYAKEVAGTPIIYDEHAYPYFFADANDNGTIDEGEGGYASFTGHLVQATYNFQVTKKDPGGYAHNPKYHIELLYDSIMSLNAQLSEPVDVSQAQRNDAGHFDSTSEAFRHWDADGEVAGTCAKCHTAVGLPTFLHNGSNIAVEPTNSLACSTCHEFAEGEIVVRASDEVTFPSGAKITFGEGEASNICLNCHQGRESTTSVNRVIGSLGDDEVSESLTFRNVHYFAAGATFFGGEAQGAYQYADKDYSGQNEHTRQFNTCTECHNSHNLEVEVEECSDCHEAMEEGNSRSIRYIPEEDDDMELVDYDGDGNAEEPMYDEIETLKADLYAQIVAYSTDTIGTTIVYESHSHPYWFTDLNANGEADSDEVNRDNQFKQWTPTLLRAAYNYQYVSKDPGVYVHNPRYALQVLYDSLEAIGGADAVASYTRPEIVEEDD